MQPQKQILSHSEVLARFWSIRQAGLYIPDKTPFAILMISRLVVVAVETYNVKLQQTHI